ncbi:hypothetical protein ACGFY6_19220 [Streptomyces sp. NPDC048387]|uniref:hypothetical protein n=1 Tax=unclassified Streptomyces TaxID=2593676 RepID=UPI0033C96A31
MSGARYARSVLARALTVACVALLCLFGASAAAAATAGGADPRPASSAPADPAEGESDPAADPDARADVRTVLRAAPGPRGLPRGTFHVKHAGESTRVAPGGPATAALTPRTVRSVVLRC